jgi:TPR repeat protein
MPRPNGVLDLYSLRLSADQNYAFAQAFLSRWILGDHPQRFRRSRDAASQLERDAFHAMGVYYHHDCPCRKTGDAGLNCHFVHQDLNKAKEYFRSAAQLGYVDSMVNCWMNHILNDGFGCVERHCLVRHARLCTTSIWLLRKSLLELDLGWIRVLCFKLEGR